jgi:hypothetical protein
MQTLLLKSVTADIRNILSSVFLEHFQAQIYYFKLVFFNGLHQEVKTRI